MNRRFINLLESLVILAILLVLVQTFFEDFAILVGWGWGIRQRILLAGFFFDLFFTVEFLIRLYYALLNKKSLQYLRMERGWIDFLASIPLLMFNSGPMAFAIFTGGTAMLGLGGILNLLKVIKAIRIARILRFLRIIKIFRSIKYVQSPMAQRHVASITAIGVTVVVFSLLAFSILSGILDIEGLDSTFFNRHRQIITYLEENKEDPADFVQAMTTLEETEENLMIVKYREKTLFSRYENGYYAEFFGPGDYSYVQAGELELFFDLRPYVKQLSRESLIFFVIVILIVLAYLLLYSPKFALTVSDPIHVMHRGLGEKDYNLEVKIPEQYREDDVFQLARLYNEKYLPLKDRSHIQEEDSMLDLDNTDIQNLLEEEKI
ncbi:hypothetical protein ES703_71925 [subsurface metagenome]